MKLAPIRVFSRKHPRRMCSIGCVAEEDYVQLLLHISCTVIYLFFFYHLNATNIRRFYFKQTSTQ